MPCAHKSIIITIITITVTIIILIIMSASTESSASTSASASASSVSEGDHFDIVIVGAGPTGLGAASRLGQVGHPNWLLVDANAEVYGASY